MIKCPCCQKEISEEAKTCPHCGQPTAYQKAQAAAGTNAVIKIISFFITAVVFAAIGL